MIRWTTVAGVIAIILGIAEIVFAITNAVFQFNFWRMSSLIYFGGSMIETPRLYALIQKLSCRDSEELETK